MTPRDYACLPTNSPQTPEWLCDKNRPVRDLLEYLVYHSRKGSQEDENTIAKNALTVRISEDATKCSENLSRQTDSLIALVAEQKELAVRMESQTNSLIRLTWAIVILSGVLVAVSAIQIGIMLK